MIRAIFFSFFLLIGGKGISQIPLGDEVNSENLKTVLLYSLSPGDTYMFKFRNSPVVQLNAQQGLVLEFDDLETEAKSYRAKIWHCDENWQQSKLLDLQFMSEINEFFIQNFKISIGGKIPYYHYTFPLPKPKISGNYILRVYDSYDEEKAIIQKAFRVVEPKVSLLLDVLTPQSTEKWRTHQQLNLELSLGSYFINNPLKELTLKVVKNQNYTSELTLPAQYLYKAGLNTYKYKNFDDTTLFEAGNEFRFIDITDPYARRENIDRIDVGRPTLFFTTPLTDRSKKNHVMSFDQDGGFLLKLPDSFNPDLAGDYFKVVFRAEPAKEDSEIRLNGKLVNWNPEKMEFNPNTGFFEKELYLKQGMYDFKLENDVQNLEGNFSDTNNTYEVFVYQKIPGKRWAELIGYTKFLSR
ncbi:MAG: type IX secretion system plug protein domain-containing protein [Leadbetterella sp.]